MLIKYLIIHPVCFPSCAVWFGSRVNVERRMRQLFFDSRPRPRFTRMRRAEGENRKGCSWDTNFAFEKLLLLMLFWELFGFYADSDARKVFYASRMGDVEGCGERNDVHKNFMRHYHSCGLRKSYRKSAAEMRVGGITFSRWMFFVLVQLHLMFASIRSAQ
jgi:hypothetical protein